jgi:transcriptional regulator with XRE-family HTH domain
MSCKLLTLPLAPRTLTSGAAALRSMRLLAGLSQERVGQLKQLDPRQVRRFENGESPVVALDLYLELAELVAARGRRAA